MDHHNTINILSARATKVKIVNIAGGGRNVVEKLNERHYFRGYLAFAQIWLSG